MCLAPEMGLMPEVNFSSAIACYEYESSKSSRIVVARGGFALSQDAWICAQSFLVGEDAFKHSRRAFNTLLRLARFEVVQKGSSSILHQLGNRYLHKDEDEIRSRIRPSTVIIVSVASKIGRNTDAK